MSVAVTIASLTIPVSPISPHALVEDVGEYFLAPENEQLLSLPVVDDGRPVGVISRYQMMNVFLKRYGRELHGRKEIATLMNRNPVLIPVDQSMEDASRYVTGNMRFPITEDFVIVRDGRYAGVGVVMDLLKAMEQQLSSRSQQLARAYRELKSSQSHLVQSEKMASLGQMVAGVAHEINTPLGYVRNNVELFLERQRLQAATLDGYTLLLHMMESADSSEAGIALQLDEVRQLHADLGGGDETESLLDDTLYGIGQIADLVSSLKDFSRVDQAMSDDIDINDCLETTLKIAHNTLKHRVQVVKKYGVLPALRCMPSKLNQVFLNLITNAAQAIEQQGTILLRTYVENARAHIVVEDNGKGMPPEVMAKVFDPFFTTKPVGQGTGLGLAIAYQIIQEHGGDIRVASRVGQGTRFVVRLPLPGASDDALAVAS
ncbi:MAG: ATPase [Gammaproteobacteria bacterium HGW-Gammaproteobacteria-1]|jgi:signal transduction histidine kinase|nr:MAG: ATPase [Gammaproteobacteria bacterium HGW-Gammaproteobacteria-1]